MYGVAAEAVVFDYFGNQQYDSGMQYGDTSATGGSSEIVYVPFQGEDYILTGYASDCTWSANSYSDDYGFQDLCWNPPFPGVSVSMQQVPTQPTTLSLTASTLTSTAGQPVTLTATLNTSGAIGEYMLFSYVYVSPDGYCCSYGGGYATLSGGAPGTSVATFTINMPVTFEGDPIGVYATYPGDQIYSLASSNGLTVTDNLPTPTLSVTTSGTPSMLGQPVTFTATINASGLDGEYVGFYDNAGSNGYGTISGNTATYTTSTLSLGTHSIYAYYWGDEWGDENYGPAASNTITQVVVNTPPPIAYSPPPPGTTDYSYTITPTSGPSGYAPNGNLLSYTDWVNGSWSNIGYDGLNRLSAATQAPVSGATQSYCWTYDAFGNRTAYVSVSGASCPSPSSISPTVSYSPQNQVTWVQNSAPIGFGYDPSGNVTSDNANQYLYDGEGRICAVYDRTFGGMTEYIYDAEGTRVAKGTISNWAAGCDTTQNGFSLSNTYVIGPSGEQLTETDGYGNWVHTNVYAAGQLMATYSYTDNSHAATDTYFALSDWLGTKRAVVSAGGCGTGYVGLPYGDSLTATSLPGFTPCPDATENHFTGKERDTESGLDYFGARYFGSSMGRFMSPDYSGVDDGPPDAIAFGDPSNPQSLNLYSYVQNSPLSNVDPDGHDCINASNASSGSVSIQTTNDPSACSKGFTYVDGTINASSLTYNTSTNTLSFDTSNYADGSGTAATNVFTQAPPYGPLEGPANLAGASLIGNTAGGVVNGIGGFELSIIFPWETLAAQLLSSKEPNGAQAAGISRKPGTLGMRKGTDALRRENKIARDVTKALGLNEKEAEAVHGLIQEGSQTFQRPMTFTEALEYVGGILGKIPK
jgi:RHS repeat-associated protein